MEKPKMTIRTVENIARPLFDTGADRVYIARHGNNVFFGRSVPLKLHGAPATQLEVFELSSLEETQLKEALDFLTVEMTHS